MPSKRKPSTPLSTTRATVKSRFVEMFGDPVQNSFLWRMAPLGENAKLINGRAYKQNELHISGKYPVLRVGNFFSNRDWYYSDLELNENKYCDNGDLLYAWSASFGPKIWDGGKVIYHYHIWKVEVGDAYNKHFLCKLLKYAEKSFLGDTHGIGMLHLTKLGMEEAPFIVPPRDLQDRFADFVARVDKLRFGACYAMYLLCAAFTLLWSTMAYMSVVSIFACPKSRCTCSMGMPLSIAFVASVRRNLCG